MGRSLIAEFFRKQGMPMKIKNLTFISCLMSFQLAANTIEDTVRSTLQQNFPQLTINQIVPSPIADLLEVSASGTILYVSKEGRYIISGDMIDLKNKQSNLTEKSRKKARQMSLQNIGEKNMIIFSPPIPQHTVTVFTDVDCGYCRKFHQDLQQLNQLGIAIRYLAFPRSGPKSGTGEKMSKIWCAQDKKQAMTLAMDNQPITGNICPDQSVTKQFELGLMMGISGTPTLIFEDGTLIPGYLSPEKLLKTIKQNHS